MCLQMRSCVVLVIASVDPAEVRMSLCVVSPQHLTYGSYERPLRGRAPKTNTKRHTMHRPRDSPQPTRDTPLCPFKREHPLFLK